MKFDFHEPFFVVHRTSSRTRRKLTLGLAVVVGLDCIIKLHCIKGRTFNKILFISFPFLTEKASRLFSNGDDVKTSSTSRSAPLVMEMK